MEHIFWNRRQSRICVLCTKPYYNTRGTYKMLFQKKSVYVNYQRRNNSRKLKYERIFQHHWTNQFTHTVGGSEAFDDVMIYYLVVKIFYTQLLLIFCHINSNFSVDNLWTSYQIIFAFTLCDLLGRQKDPASGCHCLLLVEIKAGDNKLSCEINVTKSHSATFHPY